MNREIVTPSSSASPLPRTRRATQPPPVALQPRDLALLEDVRRYRLLTTSQLELLRSGDDDEALRFPSRLPLTRRLKLLFHNRYLGRIARPLAEGSREPVYVLDREGARLLSLQGEPVRARSASQLPKALALEHLLAINQLRLSFEVACIARSQRLTGDVAPSVELLTWRSSHEAKFSLPSLPKSGERIGKLTLIPDGLLVLRLTKAGQVQRLFCFVEVDLGSETSRVLAAKCRLYYRYWQEGGFAREYHLPPQVGFRVLLVAPTRRRAVTILGAVRELPHGRGMFWVGEAEATPQQVLEPVWIDGASEEPCSVLGK